MLRKLPPVMSRALALCACALLFSAAALAQSQATTGNIEGRVLDPNGAVVPGASVTATNQETGFARDATADEDGNYRLILLPPGRYTVKATAANFATAQFGDVVVTVGGATALDLTLGVGGTTTDITVTSEAPVVETTRTSVSTRTSPRRPETRAEPSVEP